MNIWKSFPLLDQAKHASELSKGVDLIAVTRGPGLSVVWSRSNHGENSGKSLGVPVVGESS